MSRKSALKKMRVVTYTGGSFSRPYRGNYYWHRSLGWAWVNGGA